jgi:hypothetical protein
MKTYVNPYENNFKAMWALSNLAGEEDLTIRDAILDRDIVRSLVKQISTSPKKSSYARTTAWLLSNLLRGKPYPSYDKVNY